MNILNNIKTYGAIALVVVAFFAIRYFINLKNDFNRLSSNQSQLIELMKNSANQVTQLELNNKELQEYLKANEIEFSKVLNQIDENNIRLRRIQNIISNRVSVKDTVVSIIKMDSIIRPIQENKSIIYPFVDSTKCFITKGNFTYENGSASLNITNREFNDTIQILKYKERRPWKLLFFKTRLFGKLVSKDTVLSNCGNIKTTIINLK